MPVILGFFLGLAGLVLGAGCCVWFGEEFLDLPQLGVLGGLAGLVLGGITGARMGRAMGLAPRMEALEREVRELRGRVDVLAREKRAEETSKREAGLQPSPAAPPRDIRVGAPGPRPMDRTAAPAPKPRRPEPAAPERKEGELKPAPPQPPPIPPLSAAASPYMARRRGPDLADMAEQKIAQGMKWVKRFFTTGNVVARVGVIVLFFGVAFLLKYTASRYHIAIEYRFMAVAAAAIVMDHLGFRMRNSRRTYALLLQGGGIGILYMTVFFAARMYHLMPLSAAFVLMALLAALSGAAAVFQDARAMAFMALAGGFMAPVLASSGGGHHVFLFSYYAALSLGILGIAWFKAWRELNILGLAFTMSVGAAWGAKHYRPELFASTEPFLILFFVFYETVAVLYAFRQPLRLKGLTDGALVFGTPILAFSMQAALVRHIPHGLAYSALGASVFYLILARFLWRSKVQGMRVLTESFLSLCVVFGSLAIPLGLSGKWTSALWALEGAALVWIGVRQQRLLSRIFGLLLQAGAGASFLMAFDAPEKALPVFNSIYLGCFLVSAAGLFTAFILWKHRERLLAREQLIHGAAMAWGLVWWMASGLREISVQMPHGLGRKVRMAYEYNGWLLFLAATALCMHLLIRRLKWRSLGYALVCYAPVLAGAFLLGLGGRFYHDNPLAKLGYAAWPAALGLVYFLLKAHEKDGPAKAMNLWHAVGLWVVTALAAAEASWLLDKLARGSDLWPFLAWGAAPGVFAALLILKGWDLGWPVRGRSSLYMRTGLGPILAFVSLWCLSSIFHKGDPAPLPYLPLFNPLELVQAFVLAVGLSWIMSLEKKPSYPGNPALFRPIVLGAWWVMTFAASNAALARTVHYFGHVSFSRLDSSMLFQAALSIFWTLWAMALMGAGSRKKKRIPWFAGAGLIGVVTAKLIFVDLSHSGDFWRVASFLGAGALMLVVGYTSPLPPSIESSGTSNDGKREQEQP